jgi:signal transduction histidine kinase
MMLMNLLTNAQKYNESEQPRVDIRFETGPKNLTIRFEDNGIGLEKKEIRKIFRKFYQTGSVNNMSAKGSGLGLHLVQTVAGIHKWKVNAQSRGSGQGSTFSLVLPRQHAAVASAG